MQFAARRAELTQAAADTHPGRMAALLGALPLAIGIGDGGELRQPLGIAIVGGLILSQVLTLYSTPVIYLYMDRFRSWGQRLRDGGAAPLAPDTTLQPGE